MCRFFSKTYSFSPIYMKIIIFLTLKDCFYLVLWCINNSQKKAISPVCKTVFLPFVDFFISFVDKIWIGIKCYLSLHHFFKEGKCKINRVEGVPMVHLLFLFVLYHLSLFYIDFLITQLHLNWQNRKISLLFHVKICQADVFILGFFEIFVSSLFLLGVFVFWKYWLSVFYNLKADSQEDDHDGCLRRLFLLSHNSLVVFVVWSRDYMWPLIW